MQLHVWHNFCNTVFKIKSCKNPWGQRLPNENFRVLTLCSWGEGGFTGHFLEQESVTVKPLEGFGVRNHSETFTVLSFSRMLVQGGSNMTGTKCDLFTHRSSRSYLNHLVQHVVFTAEKRGRGLFGITMVDQRPHHGSWCVQDHNSRPNSNKESARTWLEAEPDFTWFSKPSACGGTSPDDKRVRELRYINHPATYAVSTGVVFPAGGGGVGGGGGGGGGIGRGVKLTRYLKNESRYTPGWSDGSVLLGYYVAYVAFKQTFWDYLSVPSLRVKLSNKIRHFDSWRRDR